MLLVKSFENFDVFHFLDRQHIRLHHVDDTSGNLRRILQTLLAHEMAHKGPHGKPTLIECKCNPTWIIIRYLANFGLEVESRKEIVDVECSNSDNHILFPLSWLCPL